MIVLIVVIQFALPEHAFYKPMSFVLRGVHEVKISMCKGKQSSLGLYYSWSFWNKFIYWSSCFRWGFDSFVCQTSFTSPLHYSSSSFFRIIRFLFIWYGTLFVVLCLGVLNTPCLTVAMQSRQDLSICQKRCYFMLVKVSVDRFLLGV